MQVNNNELQTATFGGGCFWCTEAIFQEVNGVETVKSGYSGGNTLNPTYREVCSGTTGHAEVIQITFDSNKISYKDLLRIHLSTHNPTRLNGQGADRGTQYRSVIFTHDEQESTAKEIVVELQESFDTPIVTEVTEYVRFYIAEPSHQNYYRRNPTGGYCESVINPKLDKFRKLFKEKSKTISA